jgi:peptidoglycan hydrolase-like protein with peptidoglycan-binding domain
MNILWQGARGPAVKELQARLKELGFDPGDIDGIYGPSTTAAVTAFQKDRKLFAAGIAGTQTLQALKLPTTTPGAPRPVRTKVFVSYSHADEKWLQMLQVHLAPLERSGQLARWDDTKIAPGKKWWEEIAHAI